jgi:hypothetical protein
LGKNKASERGTLTLLFAFFSVDLMTQMGDGGRKRREWERRGEERRDEGGE